MMEYRGIVKDRSKWMKVLFLVLACLMLWRTIATAKWAYLPMVALVILACFFSKEQVISEAGVDVRYTLFGRFTMHNLWAWSEITSLQTNYEKAAPNVMLLIARDVVIRPFAMTRPDIRAVQRLARSMNPDIYVDEPSEEEREEADARALHAQAVRRAQQRDQRRRKKKR